MSQRIFLLTDLGRMRAQEYLRLSQYAGPAPVTLEAYARQVKRQSVTDVAVNRESMHGAYGDAIVDEDLVDRLGAAMNSARAVFLHGPAGGGKSYLAERLARVIAGSVLVPHALIVRDHVIRVFDPGTHQPEAEPSPWGDLDARWVRCRRPAVVAGGELTLAMLDLRFDEAARYYAAPPQLIANNGLLIIDDLGRQLVGARELMNRWVGPLERRTDFLALHTGEKFAVPFDVTVVFCSNLSPAHLADEAFLRRLGYKIFVGPMSESHYRRLCTEVCADLGLDAPSQAIESLLHRFHSERRPLLACTARDLLSQVRDHARYRSVPARVSPELLDRAWANYFATQSPETSEGAEA